MKRYRPYLLLGFVLIIILRLNTYICNAAPAVPSSIDIEQPGGLSFKADLHGDEWGNWTTETSSGNVIVQDNDQYWKYAEISFGQLVPSNAKVGLDSVPSNTIKSDSWLNIVNNYSVDSEIPKTYLAGEELQSAVPIQPAGSLQKILVILVNFTNSTIQNTDSAWSNNFFGDTGSTVKNFYKENSAGNFYFTPASESYGTANDGIIRVTLNYAHPNTGSSTGDANRNIVKNALIAADPYINYASFDTNGNGYIETNELHIVTIVAGYERSCGTVTPNVWGHRWSLWGTVTPPQLDGKYLAAAGYGGYTQQGEIHAAGGNHMATIGILCHELGHDLGLPDVYNTDTGAAAVGASSVMDTGSWGIGVSGYVGSSPTNFDAWSKYYLAFATPVSATSGIHTMSSASTGNYNIVKVPTSDPNQYFLVENRNLSGFDVGLQYDGISNGGVAIWHINEDIISTYKASNKVNGNGHNPGIWLEKTGTTSDPYYRNSGVKDLFSDTSTPNSKLYDGTATNIKIKSLDTTATSMRVQIGDATTIQFANTTYSVNENAGTVTLTVTRSDSTGALTVNYASGNETATAGSDYTATSGTLSFANGEASKTIVVPILDDAVYEGNETFTVTLSNPSIGTLSSATATVTIADNEQQPATIAFSPTTYSIAENSGSVTLTVNRSVNTTGALTVNYATSNGTATTGSDYTATSGTISFASGETSKTITISILDDTTYEGNENFTVTLSNPSSGNITSANATVTITENDPVPTALIAFNPTTYSIAENSGSVTLTVTRSVVTTGALTVNYATSNGTATAGSDYTASSGTISFASGETSKTITISILDDTTYEGNENFVVTLSNPSSGSITSATATVTIAENDVQTPIVAFSPTAYSVAENGGSVTLTVNRSVVTTGTLTVDYSTSDGTANTGSDYTASSGTLTFADGETSRTITIPILDDSIYEGNENFTVTLSNPSTGNITSATSTVTITDDEAAPVVAFSPSSYSVAEDGGSVTLTVNRTGTTTGVVSVNYTTANGSASAGTDYTATSGTLTFNNGETSKTITVNITDDVNFESSETFNVNLNNPIGGVLGAAATANVTINDNDSGGGVPAGKIKTAKPTVSNGTLGQCQTGQSQQMTIIANFENGVSADITSAATWNSKYASVATVNAGLITGVAPGKTTITFTYNDQTFSFVYTITN